MSSKFLLLTIPKHRDPNFKPRIRETPPTFPLAVPPATPMRKGFLLATAAAPPLGDARSGEEVCEGRRTMLLPLPLPLSIVIEIPGRRKFKLWREKKIRDEILKAEGARMKFWVC